MANRIVLFFLGVAALSIGATCAPVQAQKFVDSDAHDFDGVWVAKRMTPPPAAQGANGGAQANAPNSAAAQGNFANPHPPFTPWAQARFDAAIPSGGARDIPGKENDPTLKCDPDGFPKILGSPEPFEIVMTDNRMLMFFEKDHIWREIWMDGRKLPEDPDITWNGTSVGHWEGDTLVVESDGMKDVTWLDYQGDPHSDQMHLTERYKKIGADEMELDVTVNDPKAYTAPWVFKPKFYARHKDWEIHEWYCTQADTQSYDQQIRVPSGEPAPSK